MSSPVAHTPNRSRDDMVSAARKKLKTFRAKQGHSPMSSLGNHSVRRSHSRGSSISSVMDTQQSIPVATETTRHAKRRSHSRSASILQLDTDNDSSSMTLPSFTRSPQPESKPDNLGGLNRSFSFGGSQARPMSAAPVVAAMPSSPVRAQAQQGPAHPRPSSHHRRRSSMATRRESVDMMGFDPAALKSVDEPIKDDVAKVRERALLALEGKTPRPGKARTVPEIVPNLGFSKVEIPDWKTPDVERTFDWSIGNSIKSGAFSLGLNSSIAGKRDSFGKNLVPSSSTKAELSVLLEEEEEEEEPAKAKDDKTAVQSSDVVYVPGSLSGPMGSPTEMQTARSPSPGSRPRPASLNLKALTRAASANVTALPTPSPTPSPTPRSLPGMKPLNLGNGTTYAARRQSMMALSASSPRNSLIASRRQSLRSDSHGSGSTHSSRDSLSQSALVNRLPPTPATGSPTSASSAAAGVEGFLQKNQELLISRIDQLEKALAKSQRLSGVSDTSSVPPSLAEEQIALVADLKSERNTLVEDVAGYRARVSELERQAALYAKRVESERREAFVARERAKELEAERSAWEADRTALNETIVHAREDAAAWRGKFEEASKNECHWHTRAVNLEADMRRLEKELATARMAQYATGPAASPNKRWNGVIAPRRFDGSMSSASTTDVEDASSMSGEMDVFKIRPRAPSPLPNMDVVVEEDEEEVYEDSYEEPSLDEDESHGVEEDEDDVASDILDEVNGKMSVSHSMDSFTSPSSRTTELPAPIPTEPTVPGAFPASSPSHARTGSMVRGWQMPLGPVAVKNHSTAKPDRFFDQLEHLYASSEDESPNERAVPVFEFGSPELGMVKGDGGASAFTFGTRRSVMNGAGMRGHGTRASRASISVGAFDGCGMPPIENPKPEWIVKTESVGTKAEVPAPAAPALKTPATASNALQTQVSSAGGSPVVSQPCPSPRACDRQNPVDVHQTPTTAKPPKFIAAPAARIVPSASTNSGVSITRPSTSSSRSATSSTNSSTTPRALVRRKPSLTRAQPTGRAPPRVPLDTSHDKSRSPFSISYSRTSSRSSGSRASIAAGQAEAAAIEAAIAQARAQAQSRLTLAGLTSFLPWGGIGLGNSAGVDSVEPASARVSEEQRPLVRHESGRVSREAQLARLRAAGQPRALSVSSGPCCTRCRSDVIQL